MAGAWMAARGGAMLQLQLRSNSIGEQLSKEFKSLGIQLGWGLDGCSRSRGYNYMYNKIELGINFQKKLNSLGI